MYCRNCGKEIDNHLAQCPYCNTPVTQETIAEIEDNGSLCWGVLSCCIPIVGLVLYIVWKDTKPKSAKKAIIGALIGVILGFVSSFFINVILFSAI